MATKAQFVSSGAPAVAGAGVNANPGIPAILIGAAATSRVPSVNLESVVTKKEALEAIAEAINASSISVRRGADGGGRSKVTETDVATVLGAIVS